jgi:hypothetical protein
MENSYLNLPIDDEDSLLQLEGAFVSYRIATGPLNKGKKCSPYKRCLRAPRVNMGS